MKLRREFVDDKISLMKHRSRLLEMEVGGSWIRFNFFHRKRKNISSFKIPAVPLRKLPLLLAKRFKKFLPTDNLLLGAKGVWTKKEKRDLEILMRPFAKKVHALSDVEFAYQKIFRKNEGIVLIAGTGSIAYGRDAQGKICRAGGLGPHKGDKGSGYWIGREWSHKRSASLQKVREIAARTPEVLEKAKRGNRVAEQIVHCAWDELLKLVVKVSKKLKFQKRAPLALYGGLFKNQFFREGFLKKLNFSQGGKFRVKKWR